MNNILPGVAVWVSSNMALVGPWSDKKIVNNVGELDQSFVEKHYIAGSVVEIYTNGNSSVPERRYMHKDNLGSVVMITDAKGKVIERHNFDPWGEKRDLAGMRIPEYLQLEASARFGRVFKVLFRLIWSCANESR